jgi:uncharacterized membrane protein (UPF0182 family)
VSVAVGDTTRGLAPPFGVASHAGEAPAPANSSTTSAASLYAAMRDALRRGDWTAFGRAFEALGKALGQSARP